MQGLEPDAEGVAAGTGATPAAFYLGLCRLRGILSPPTSAILQAGHSPLPQRKLESDAEFCRGGDCSHSGGFLLRIMPPSWHPVPACVRYGILQAKPFSLAATKNRIGRRPRCRNDRSRRNHSLLPQRKLESDAEHRCRYDNYRRAIPHCSSEDAASIPKFGPEIKNRCTQEGINRQNLASISKFEPKIKNRCTPEGVNGHNLAAIPKSGLEIKNRCTQEGVNRQNHASIPKFGLEVKNRCTPEGINRQNLASIRKSGIEIKNRCMQQAIFSTRSLDESL